MPHKAVSVLDRLEKRLSMWVVPELPASVGDNEVDIESIRQVFSQRLAGAEDKTRLQIEIAGWLYRLVRANVKRGRAFELDEVRITRLADCLGYSRLMAALGPMFGLKLGVVEVLIDNAGRYVPHHVNLLNLPDGSHRFIDAWYGSKNIHHQRIGALVDGWPRDIEMAELGEVNDLQGLPEPCLDAIVCYIKGNRSLQANDFDKAIRYYTRAIRLYPNNSRAFYNRALAYEARGDLKKAELDYAGALKDEASVIRVMATTCELEYLIKLDENGIKEEEQDVYLCYRGFKTGAPVSFEAIGRAYGLTVDEVDRIIFKVEQSLAHG